MRTGRRLGLVICLLVTGSSSGCQQTVVTDKAGSDVIQLRFATVDDVNSNGQTPGPGVFVQALEHLSGGRITVTVASSYENGAVRAESDIVEAIAHDKFDGGWPNTRAFARAGISGLEAVEAPMTLTSYAAERALVSGPAAAALLKTLAGSGVLGLGLTVGPLRRPFSVAADLTDADGWRGVTFRTFNSPVQEATVRALGAVPVSASYNFPDLVQAGTLKAAETDVAQYALNSYGTLLPRAVGNVVLWPRMPVLAFSQKRFDTLTRTEQGWVRQAAAEAVSASVAYQYNEDSSAVTACQQGVRFLYATPAQLRALKTAVQPVLAQLAHDPATAPGLAIVQAEARSYSTPDTVDVPSRCRSGGAASQSSAHAAVPSAAAGPATGSGTQGLSPPDSIASIPDGEYRTSFGQLGSSTLTVHAGTYDLACGTVGDCGGTPLKWRPYVDVGTLHGTGDTVWFVPDPARKSRLTGCARHSEADVGCGPEDPYRFTWQLRSGHLSFRDFFGLGDQAGQADGYLNFTSQPWDKIH